MSKEKKKEVVKVGELFVIHNGEDGRLYACLANDDGSTSMFPVKLQIESTNPYPQKEETDDDTD